MDNSKHRLLFIGDGSLFLKNAIISNLREVGFDIIEVKPDIKKISNYQSDVESIILFLGDDLMQEPQLLVYIKDMCIETGKYLYLVGETEHINECLMIFPESIVAESFPKPLDIRELVARVDALSDNPNLVKRRAILLVDDDGDYLKLASSWLETRYRVVIVSSGMQAITYLATNRPDLILLDYNMPVTNGAQILEMIKSDPGVGDIPVFFLTGADNRESVMKAVELEPAGYLLKSIGKDELLSKIDQFFQERRLL